MKKVIIALVFGMAVFAGSVQAAACNTSYKFKAYMLNPNGSYSLILTTTNANYLISQIAANPSVSGYVKGQDLVCDGYDFWSFGGGTWWPARS